MLWEQHSTYSGKDYKKSTAEESGLEEPYVMVKELLGRGVEIVSPSFMNQRQLAPDKKVIPDAPVLHARRPDSEDSDGPAPEEMIFDKADEAANLEVARQQQENRSEPD